MKTAGLGLIPLLLACVQPPQSAPLVRTGTTVQSSFTKTWDAVIDLFADRNIPIRTIDRSSGLIATDVLSATGADKTWADCGSAMQGIVVPDKATYNVLVRGDSSHSTVKVTVRWVGTASSLGPSYTPVDCVSRGVWETEFEQAVTKKAEGRP